MPAELDPAALAPPVQTAKRPLVLLSNDDGYASRGIRALFDALSSWADVVMVAPESEQSASSHSLSLHHPLRARAVEKNVFAIDGTPADCVYVALHAGTRFLPRWPDLVCSGINRGLNLGQDAFYSGTVAAAREGALRGIPAVASSAHPKGELPRFAERTSLLARALFDATKETVVPRPGPSVSRSTPLLNLNFPREWSGEVRRTRLGARVYEEVIDVRVDPRGREYMWLGGPGVHHDPEPGTDTDAYDEGAASVTPLILDLTRADDGGITEHLLEKIAGV
ncbi:MAG: 5'/3'-nucleotidase SurE [Labilithrix sp.]|nr:5'/3'-nucleotidase SurE [Labilithrix sp.]MBX3215482.1 5'/3'-nucleotidase SurE [Labilithrix sp.]